jgi:hypothetical protein
VLRYEEEIKSDGYSKKAVCPQQMKIDGHGAGVDGELQERRDRCIAAASILNKKKHTGDDRWC